MLCHANDADVFGNHAGFPHDIKSTEQLHLMLAGDALRSSRRQHVDTSRRRDAGAACAYLERERESATKKKPVTIFPRVTGLRCGVLGRASVTASTSPISDKKPSQADLADFHQRREMIRPPWSAAADERESEVMRRSSVFKQLSVGLQVIPTLAK
jgi:hypothetical protein